MSGENSARPAYRAALYLRVSKEDGAGESVSIATQRGILLDYAASHALEVVGEYVDDGYSGTDFARPAFLRLQRDIEAGKVNCLLLKDLSRLGRNSSRTNDLLDEYFPAHGVRCIAVTDGYDSQLTQGGAVLLAPLLAVMNELYARDISNKIRSALHSKQAKGEYIGSYAPYGYKKDTEHGCKNRLIPDLQAAPVVRRIFVMAAEDMPPARIAAVLNGERLATPLDYRQSGRLFRGEAEQRRWTSASVCKILKNAVYLGVTEQGKSVKLSFKSSAVKQLGREEWQRVSGTHEPLLTQELFAQAAARRITRRSEGKGFENIFSGLAVCADCGRAMSSAPTRRRGAEANLCCGAYKARGTAACGNHFIDYGTLCEVTSAALRDCLRLTGEEAALPQRPGKALLRRLIERIEVEQGEYLRDAQGKRRKRQRIRIYYRFAAPAAAEEKSCGAAGAGE